jgi:hypothetical protein
VNPSDALIQSLLVSPLLVGELPDAERFDRQSLVAPAQGDALNFNQKLGHLYEDALASVLDSSPDFELLERNLQIQQDAHSTLGELDFLIRGSDGQLTHLELATKFYLAVKDNNGVRFPGPDSRDNYDRKIRRLLSHQLSLTKRHKSVLPPAYREAHIAVKHLIYGCLFDHISDRQMNSPAYINPECRRGKWLRNKEVAGHFSDETEFYHIPKHLWPVPITLLEDIPLKKWRPDTPVDRCQMLRIAGADCPYFIAPDEYPQMDAAR